MPPVEGGLGFAPEGLDPRLSRVWRGLDFAAATASRNRWYQRQWPQLFGPRASGRAELSRERDSTKLSAGGEPWSYAENRYAACAGRLRWSAGASNPAEDQSCV